MGGQPYSGEPDLSDPGSLETQWSNLSKSAGQGSFGFAPSIAADCVKACIAAIESLQGLRQNSTKLLTIPNGAFGTLPYHSGDLLEAAFNKLVGNMNDSLDVHSRILTDMGDTFISAATAYAKADHESTSSFTNLSGELHNPTPAALQYGVDTDSLSSLPVYGQSRYNNTTGNVPGFNVPEFNFPVDYENLPALATGDQPGSMAAFQLVTLGQTIDNKQVYTAANNWTHLYLQLNSTRTTLAQQISKAMESGSWFGYGASSANEAVYNEVCILADLASHAMLVANNLAYAQDWLAQAKAAMPTSATVTQNGKSYPMDAATLNSYRDLYQSTYASQYDKSRKDVPTIVAPQSKNNNGNNQNQNGGNKGNNNGGTNNGNNGAANNGSSSGAGSHSGAGAGSQSGTGSGAGVHSGSGFGAGSVSGSGFGAGSHSGSGSGVDSQSGFSPGSAVGSGAAASGASTAAQQQAQAAQALQQGLQTGLSALQQALQAGQQAAQQALAAGQQAAAQNALSALTPSDIAGLADKAAAQFGGTAAGSAGSGMGAGAVQALGDYQGQSRLFPRAGLIGPTAPGSPAVAVPGVAAGSMPSTGSPMGGMGGAGQNRDNDKAHKRAKYLDSTANLDEAFGTAPDMARPIVGAADPATEQAQPVEQPVTVRTVEGESQEPPVSSRKTKVRVHRPDQGQGRQITV
ncbi:hypothetical protein KO481_40200 [Nocardia sp. NEAU-G5]|uniref:PPE domain-containing protein n=1 Tax=Nocardia albiluteola TaxID=2842303 RepID=A0ABS6BBR7_9NOCA|nr:hypothetical protein [Nocardia albiluteola]MBU3067729.1 hypothetical protein [Nocardia albiluteola]